MPLPVLYVLQQIVRGVKRAAFFVKTPTPTEHPVDLLEWEVSMARYHSSPSSALALFFAVTYCISYLPTELGSLSKHINVYYNLTSPPGSIGSTLGDGIEAGGARNSVLFYIWRVSSRITLVALMSFLLGIWAASQICIPTAVYNSHLVHGLFQSLRELLRNRQPDPQQVPTLVETIESLELLTESNLPVLFDVPQTATHESQLAASAVDPPTSGFANRSELDVSEDTF